MPIIYTYPSVAPASGDLLLISDVSETDPEKATRTCTIGDIVSLVGALVPGGGTLTSVTVSDGTYVNLTATPDPITTTGSITADLNAADGAVGASGRFLTKENNWAVPPDTDTTYTAGDGLDLTGTTFSTDLRANGGLVINATELQVDLAATDMAGILRVVDGGTGVGTLADHGILLGSGTTAITATAAPTVGQILVGVNATSDPVLSRLQAGAGMTIDDTSVPGQITLASTASGMNSFTLAGSAGVGQSITNGDTVTIEAGANISTTGAATDKVTVAWVVPTKTAYDTQLGLSGSTSGLLLAAAFTTNLASYYQIGEKMYIEFYLEWTSAAGAALVGNLILTGLPIAAYQTGAAIDNGNCVIHLNDNLGRSAGNEAPTTGWVAKSGVSREMTFRSCDSTTHIFEDYNYDQRLVEGSPAYKLAGTITYMTA